MENKLETALKDLDRKDQQIKKLISQLDELTRQRDHFHNLVQDITSSSSWRVTAPVRALFAAVRNLKTAIRFSNFRYRLQPGRNVEKSGDEFVVKGLSPTLLLEQNGLRYPCEWVEIKGELRCPNRELLLFLLYYKQDQEFNGAHRVWVPLGPGQSTIVRLPKGITGFRLDPFDTDIRFKLDELSIRELGGLQLLTRVLVKQFGNAFRRPKEFASKFRKGLAILKTAGIAGLKLKLFQDNSSTSYEDWVKKYDTISEADRAAIKAHIEELPHKPLISVVMPTYNTDEKWLTAAIESVRAQLYQNWELCIADDNSSDPQVRKVLTKYSEFDKRIKVVFREKNGHIAEASNSALALATGEFTALLDHDDALSEHALYMVAAEVNNHPAASFIYSDEDKITSFGMRVNPHFKSDWNPDLFTSQMYTCHLGVYRTELVKKLGGFRAGFDGSQDWDLALRVADAIPEDQIRHIPHVLYHWRIIEGSTAHSTASKPYVLVAQKRAVEDHLKRRGVIGAEVSILHDISHVRVHYPVPDPEPLVSIIIPTKDQAKILETCVYGILFKTKYKNIELIIVDNGSIEDETLEYFKQLERDPRVRIIHDPKPFNYSRINNDAAKSAKGQIIAFLNNDLEVIDSAWLGEMVSHAVRKEVGAVGARLLFPNGLLQHGGVILGIGGVAGHNHKGRMKADPGYFNRAILLQDLSAVTAACLVMRREVFDRTDGFDEGRLAVAFNDVDLCLQVRKLGLRVVYNPYAELYHHESVSRGYETTPEKFTRFEGEIEAMKERWQEVLERDPYYNPNLTLLTEDFALGYPPRVGKPWGRK